MNNKILAAFYSIKNRLLALLNGSGYTGKISPADKIKIFNKNLRNIIIALFIITVVLLPYGSLIIHSLINFSISPPFMDFTSYERVIDYPMFRHCLVNSLVISIGTTLISILTALFASYALSRIRSSWRKAYELFLYILQMFPGIAFIVPFFIIFILIKRYFFIPMQNTYHGLIITYTSFALPFTILMLKNFVSAIPKELDEQAQIDGCSRLNLIFRIILPLALPGILAVSIFSFIMSWNEILFAFTLTKNETMTASIYIIKKMQMYSYNDWMDWNTACVLVTLPVVIIFAFLQKKLISGLSTNYIK